MGLGFKAPWTHIVYTLALKYLYTVGGTFRPKHLLYRWVDAPSGYYRSVITTDYLVKIKAPTLGTDLGEFLSSPSLSYRVVI